MLLEVPAELEAGDTIRGRLQTAHLPQGSSFSVAANENPAEWRTPGGTFVIDGAEVELEFNLPVPLEIKEGSFKPPCRIAVQLEYQGRKFDTVTLWPTLQGGGTKGE